MKKFAATILAFIYLSTSMGATVHLHYCMGSLISWGLVDHESKNCNYCGMPKTTNSCELAPKGCCTDEHKHIQTEKDQKAGEFIFQSLKSLPAIPLGYSLFQVGHLQSTVLEFPKVNSPPFSGKVSLFILNCVYRI